MILPRRCGTNANLRRGAGRRFEKQRTSLGAAFLMYVIS
jgi:hypothetical protein